MKIYLFQTKPRVGDLNYNFTLIEKCYAKALAKSADLCLFPELATTGYYPEDLLLNPSFLKELNDKIEALILKVGSTIALIPTPLLEEGLLYNGVLAIRNGKVIGKTYKKHLPNYGIFDEKRYFTSGNPKIIQLDQIRIGLPICEDIWFPDVCQQLKNEGAEILLVTNASPYEKGKWEKRMEHIVSRYRETGLPIIYCNQVLGQDGIIYDGRSIVFDGELKHVLASFREDERAIEFADGRILGNKYNYEPVPIEDELYGAMVLGLRDYVTNNGAKSVVIGLSGGIDSALVTAIAADSLGAGNVKTVMLQSKYTSLESMEDAKSVAKMLGVSHENIPINHFFEIIKNSIPSITDLAAENMQARIRGLILMAISNSTGSLLLTTGNKSEMATGYATLYGDMCGAFNPIKDLYKTEIYRIAKYRNTNLLASIDSMNKAVPIMPERIMTKAPSAELRENQKDSDSLPEYEILDKILTYYIEHDFSAKEITKLGFDQQLVQKVIKLVKNSEFKRRQAAPGIKLSTRSFEKERRYPITCG